MDDRRYIRLTLDNNRGQVYNSAIMRRLKVFAIALGLLLASIGTGLGIAYSQAEKPLDIPSVQSTEPVVDEAAIKAKVEAEFAEKERVALTIENLVKFTNEERMKAGLQPLVNNPLLNASAQAKAQDMAAKNYWGHNSPDGQEPWVFITAQGYSYQAAGENLACGFRDSREVVIGWMNSPTHKANMVNSQYTQVGFGIVPADNYYCGNFPKGKHTIIVQHFATPY